MASLKLGSLAATRRQHLLVEFSGLKQACPDGIYMNLTPGYPSLWSGVLFVRKGPYAPAVLRFQISFPSTFPRLPPVITFSSDMFHPLITPLTTYTYTTDIQDNGTVSATDEERLPPGGFSLRHGFPQWFGRRRAQSRRSSQPESIMQRPPRASSDQIAASPTPILAGASGTPNVRSADSKAQHSDISVYEVLEYLKSTFDDETVLGSVPFEAAGNPGAWQAWRSKQQAAHRKAPKAHRQQQSSSAGVHANPESVTPRGHGKASIGEKELPPTPGPLSVPLKDPSDWDWEGVWEDRVQKGVAATLTESVLYGNAGIPDEVMRFLPLDEGQIEAAKATVRRTLSYPT